MSYVLIDGKRYYKDDRTGRVTLDNVSQAEADRRAQKNKGVVRTSGTSRSSAVNSNGNNRTAANPVSTNHTVRTTTGTGIPWKVVIVCVVIALFIGAFFYNRFHISSEEQAINNYMNAQQVQAAIDTVEAKSVSSDDVWDGDAEETEKDCRSGSLSDAG